MGWWGCIQRQAATKQGDIRKQRKLPNVSEECGGEKGDEEEGDAGHDEENEGKDGEKVKVEEEEEDAGKEGGRGRRGGLAGENG